ncbi:MAG: hypothetical protein J0L66_10585 [Cytophagales bacterium]|nr:hypothetical protein [Cytophagales bacterium]
MSLLKSIYRLKRLDSLIKKEATGTAEEFAEKIGISRSMLMINLDEMREMGALIKFCPIRKTYYYAEEFNLLIGNMVRIKGGNNIGIDTSPLQGLNHNLIKDINHYQLQ